MQRKIGLYTLVLLVLMPLCAQATFIDLSEGQLGLQAGTHLLEQGDDYVMYEIAVPALYLHPVKNRHGRFVKIDLPGAGVWGRVGEPALPAFHTLIQIPALGSATARVVDRTVQRVVALGAEEPLRGEKLRKRDGGEGRAAAPQPFGVLVDLIANRTMALE